MNDGKIIEHICKGMVAVMPIEYMLISGGNEDMR